MPQGQKKINAETLEGFILCRTGELGLHSVNHWEALTDLKQGLKKVRYTVEVGHVASYVENGSERGKIAGKRTSEVIVRVMQG